MPETQPIPMCPMAEICKGMIEKPFSRSALVIPGIIFVALGALIVFEPRILAWIIAASFVLLGIMMITAAGYIRKIGTRWRNTDRPAD